MLSPFHETLYAHYHLGEHRWIDALTTDAEGLQAAKRSAIAFHNPKDLADERIDLLDRMGGLPDPAEAVERGRRMLEDLKKVDARRAEAENGD